MKSAPASIRRLLMPLKTAVATSRHAPSAAASSELAGCCCAGARAEFIKTAYHCYGRETTLGCKRPAVSHPGSSRGLFLPLNATIIDLIYPDYTRFGPLHGC